MKPSEELILFLELNNYNIEELKLKAQTEYEKSGNLDLHKHEKYADLLINYYSYLENKNYIQRNPLSYKYDWDEEVNSIDQFMIHHPNLDKGKTVKEFILSDKYDKNKKEIILNQVVENWLNEYLEAKHASVENLRMINSITTRNVDKYKKPSELIFFLTIIFILLNILFFGSGYINEVNQLLNNTLVYSLLGAFSTILFIVYAILSNSLSRHIKDLRYESNTEVVKTFQKFDKDMEKACFNQWKILDSYVNLVIKKPEYSRLELMSLIGPEILIDKLRVYNKIVDKKQNWISKNYSKKMNTLRKLFIFTILYFLVFLGLGILISRGLINV